MMMNFTFFRLNVKRVFFYYFLSLAYVDLQEGEKTHTCVCGCVCFLVMNLLSVLWNAALTRGKKMFEMHPDS